MDVGNLFQLQGALHRDCIVDTASDEKDVFCRKITVGKTLYVLLVGQQQRNLLRQALETLDHRIEVILRDGSAYFGKLHRQKILRDKLCAVRFRCRNSDLRTGPGVHDIVCLTCNRASDYVYNTKGTHALFFCKAESRKSISRLTRLADDDHERIFRQNRITVAELACQIYLNRDSCQLFEDVFCCHTGVVCGTAGNDKDFADRADFLIGHAEFFDHNITVFNTRSQRIFYGFWLLMHFFQHEMLIAAFFCRIHIPVDVGCLFLQLLLVDVVEMKAIAGQFHDLLIFQVIDVSCIFQDSRDIRCDQIALRARSYNQRAVFADRINLIRVIAEHDAKAIGSLHAVHDF